MDEFLVSKQELLLLIDECKNPNSEKMEEICRLCYQNKVKAHNHHELVALLFLVILFKQTQFETKNVSFDYFFYLKNLKDNQKVVDFYEILRLTNFEILQTIIHENDPIDENSKVDFLTTYATFNFVFFRSLKCVDICNSALFRDPQNCTINFFKSSLIDLCYIVKHNDSYKLAIELYRQQMLKYVAINKLKFDSSLANVILSITKRPIYMDSVHKKMMGLYEIKDGFSDTEVGKKYWSKEQDYYLKNTLFLNPLNNFGKFIQASIEELNPLDISSENQDLFNSIIEDYKFARKKVYEFVILKTISLREMCSIYSFIYSIYDKMAFLFKKVYEIDVSDDIVNFTEKNLFSKTFKNSDQKFSEIKNPAIMPLYLEMIEVRSKNKVGGWNIGTYELNEYRNIIEHKSTLLVDENVLQTKSEMLIRNVRDLIIQSYMLLFSAKSNMNSDDVICAGTAYTKGILLYNAIKNNEANTN